MQSKMIAGVSAGVSIAACIISSGAFADDAIGVVRVDAGTNGLVEVEMPFAPMSDIGPLGYVSGLFAGDGGAFSDRLFLRNPATGEMTNAVWSYSAWLDPASLLPSFMQAHPGDTLYFMRTDAGPFDFSVFGRLPLAATPPSSPYFPALSVDPAGETVSLDVFSPSSPYDVFSAHGTNVSDAASSAWLHLARNPAAGLPLSWSDPLPYPGSARLYMVSDASRDTDGDGLSDALESLVYGTSPHIADTDGDGIPDGCEVAWGRDPLVAGIASPFSWFEGFERPLVLPGAIDGQNCWSVTGDVSAVVGEGSSFEGAASLEIRETDESGGEVTRRVAADADEVWVDMRVRTSAVTSLDGDFDCSIAFAAAPSGLLAVDGTSVRTNSAVVIDTDDWVRFTCRLDYGNRLWDLYVEGVAAFSGLHMRGNAPRMSEVAFDGGDGSVDAISISTDRPLGLSSDGDRLPDEWEVAVFGSLGRDGSGDFDSDGLPDAAEFRAGTDPLSPDSDSDGIPDAWELSHGLDPLDAADAALDPDGDGLANSLEFALCTDPGFFEPDPRIARQGLRAEFRMTSADLEDIPDFSGLVPFAACAAEGVSYSDGSWPAAVEQRGDGFACRLSGFVLIPVPGPYTFYVTSDDGSRLVVGGVEATADVAPHSARERSGTVQLDAGWRPVSLEYYENAGNAVLSLSWSGPGFSRMPVPASSLRHLPENLPPVVSVAVSDGPLVEGLEMAVSASAVDVDGTVVSVSLYDGDVLLGVYAGGEAAHSVGSPSPGVHRFRAVAVDSEGASAEAEAEVIVSAAPAGFEPGLAASYYSFQSSLSALPDFPPLSPVATGVVRSISFPASELAWEGAPEGLTNRFAAAFEGALMVPEPGVYTLSLRSDDGSRLFVDGLPVVDNDGNHSMRTASASLPLSAGLHDLRVEYYENSGNAGLELSWTRPDGVSEAVPPGYLFRLAGAFDSDSDGMPDWWEGKFSLDPADPSDAALDPDGDGLSNLAEFQAGTDPRSPDTDSDGMPDAWELVNGLCPFVDDALEDPDNDGLVNVEELLGGSAPVEPDTDGDGMTDYEERMQLGTDPTVADSVSMGDLVVSSKAGESMGFVVSSPKAFAVDVSLLGEWRDYGAVLRPPSVTHQVLFCVDGRFVASRGIPFDSSNIVHVVFYTPVLPVGPHEVSVEWRSPDFRARADVVGIDVYEVSGVDFSDIVRRRNSVPAGIVSSMVSPAFVEGTALFPWLVSATGATVRPCGSGSWYMDVPLSPVGGSSVDVLFEGLVATNVAVAWEPADLFSGASDIAVRQGSSLLFSGIPQGAQGGLVQVFTNGAFACSYDSGASAALAFAAEGVWLVHAAWIPEGDGEPVVSDAMQVTCRGGAFPSASPACVAGQSRTWACPGISTNLVFQTDAYTHLSKSGDGTLGLLVDDTRGERVVAARLSEGGPVLDTARICALWAVDSFSNEAYLVESSDDCDRCRCYMRQHGAPPDVSFRVRSYTSSVFLDDFSTERWIGPSAFDKDGVAWFEFVKSKGMAAPCHTVEVYQGGIRIGEAVYGNGTLPEELR